MDKGNTEKCSHNAKEVAAHATKFKPGHWCFLGPGSECTCWTEIPTKLKDIGDIVAPQLSDTFKYHTSHPIFQRQNHCRLDSWGKEDWITLSKVFSTTKTILASNVLFIYKTNLPMAWNWKSDTYTENRCRRRANRSRTRAVDLNYAETATTDTSSRRLGATHSESRNDDSESFRTSSLCQNGGEWKILHRPWICYGRKQLCFFMLRRLRTNSKFETTSSSHRSCQDWTSDWNWSIQICRNFGDWSMSTDTTTRKWKVLGTNITRNWTIRKKVYTDHQDIEAVFITVITQLRATTSRGNRWKFASQIQSCANAKAYINWFQSARLGVGASKSVNQKRLWIRTHLQPLHKDSTSWSLSWSWRSSTMGSCFDKHVKCCANSVDKKQWIDALGRSTDKPRMECCEDQKGTNIDIRALQGHSHCVRVNPTLFTEPKIPLNWKEHIFHTGSSSNLKINLRKWSMAWGLSLRSTRQPCFFSPLNPQDSSSRQRTIDWTGPVHEEWYCTSKAVAQILIVFLFHFTTSSRRKLGLSSKEQWRNYFVRQHAGKRTGEGGHFLQVRLCSKRNPRHWQSQRRLWVTEGTCAYLAGRKTLNCWTRERETQKHFSSPAWWNKSWSLQAHRRWSLAWSKTIHKIMQKSQLFPCSTERLRKTCSTERQLGTTWSSKDRRLCSDCAHSHSCFKYRRPGETFCSCGSILQGITAEVTKQARQRINDRFIMCVPGVHKWAWKNIQRGRPYGNSATSRTLKKARDYLGSARNWITVQSRSATSRPRSTKEQGTRNPTWQMKKWTYVAPSYGRLIQSHTTLSRKRQRYQKDQRTPWIRPSCTVEKESMTKQATEPGSERWSSWSSWAWSLSSRSSWWDYSSSSQTWRQSEWPTTSDVSATRLDHKETTPAQGDLLRNDSDSVLFHSSNWQSESDNPNRKCTRIHTVTRTLSAFSLSQTHMRRSPHTKALLWLKVGLKIIPSSHHLADLPCLRATDYNFHHHNLKFSAPCWFFIGTLGSFPLRTNLREVFGCMTLHITSTCVQCWRRNGYKRSKVCSDSGFNTWQWRHKSSHVRHPVAASRKCKFAAWTLQHWLFTVFNRYQIKQDWTLGNYQSFKCTCSSGTSRSGSTGYTTSSRRPAWSARSGSTCSCPLTRRISCCHFSKWSGCEAKPCQHICKTQRSRQSQRADARSSTRTRSRCPIFPQTKGTVIAIFQGGKAIPWTPARQLVTEVISEARRRDEQVYGLRTELSLQALRDRTGSGNAAMSRIVRRISSCQFRNWTRNWTTSTKRSRSYTRSTTAK